MSAAGFSCGGRGGGCAGARERRHRLALADDGDLFQDHGSERLVAAVARDAGNGLDDVDAGLVALAEEGVVLVEGVDGLLGDEELAAVGVGSGVGHGQLAGPVEVQVGIELVVEAVAGIAHAGAGGVAALDHELGNDAMEGGAVVERLVVLLLVGRGVGPVLGALGQRDEVGYRLGRLLLIELAGDAAHGGVHDDDWAIGTGQGGCGGLGRVGQVRWPAWRLLGRSRGGKASGQGGDEKRMFDVHDEFEGKSCGVGRARRQWLVKK